MRSLEAEGFRRSVAGLVLAVAFLVAWGLWCLLVQVDVIVLARGALRPGRPEVPISSSVAARVREVHVREGDAVKPGQLLFKLESRVTATEVARLKREKENLDQVRREVATQLPLEESRLRAEMDAEQRRLQALQQQLNNFDADRQARLAAVDAVRRECYLERSRRFEEVRQARLAVSQADRNVKTTREILETNRRLAEKGLVSRLALLDMENKWQIARTEASRARSEVSRTEQSVNQILDENAREEAQATSYLADLDRRQQEVRSQMLAPQARIEQIRSELDLLQRKSRERLNAAEAAYRQSESETAPGVSEKGEPRGLIPLHAPAAGRVVSLRVKEAGAVVRPGDILVQLMDDRVPLEVEAWVANRDASGMRLNQPARVKLDAYPLEQYGTVPAVVTWMSPDAEKHEQLGLAYRVKCRLESQLIAARPLLPGLTGTVEIIGGKRRIVDLLLQTIRETAEQ